MGLQHITISPDNPFKHTVSSYLKRVRNYTESGEEQTIAGTTTQVSVYRQWIPVTFSQLYQHKQVLGELSPEACKIFMHIALNLGRGEQMIDIKRESTGLSKYLFSRGMVELMAAQVIAKVAHKRERYWVNLTIILHGKLKQQEDI